MVDADDFNLSPQNLNAEIRSRELESVARADSVLRWFRSCAVCHSPLPPIDLLCRKCWKRLSRVQNRGPNLKHSGYRFPVYSLYTWTDDTEALVRPLIHAFKGGWALRAARIFAEAFAYEMTGCEEASCLLYPPSSRRSQKDHSWLWAQVLAENFAEGETLRLTSKPGDSGHQKGKNAHERAFRRYESVEPTEKFSSRETSWMFVDDVITTGSTATAAYMALGDPDRFAVFTLACRPKLAGKSTI